MQLKVNNKGAKMRRRRLGVCYPLIAPIDADHFSVEPTLAGFEGWCAFLIRVNSRNLRIPRFAPIAPPRFIRAFVNCMVMSTLASSGAEFEAGEVFEGLTKYSLSLGF
jgi:hypothetical protein